ncbi:DNA-binding LacI/PurR family transcriptional regulator [Agromyces cerinus]|uniref:LacI family DNA-binding transcriptional regulator n=1 Tax=Agromyces cerinus TaxID=33878 RepID=UPI00195B254F|nr:LacI family DNA-binding transcriptional regulator [Agromyces cerinus]MBM7830840.1 DNA-binding LacI/PurR family transcriptional regulator [Agromyces cerinus]
MAKVGLAAVAEAAGVSEATVSRVVNNPSVVASETRRVVEEAMRRVGYTRPTHGSLVLLVTPGIRDPFFAHLADRIAAALGPQGLRAVICSAPVGGTQELDFVTAMIDAGAVGVVFVSASNTLEEAEPAVHRLLTSRGIPFVCINGNFPGVPAPGLSTNDLMASELAVDHLWHLGHRRIGLAAGPVGNRPSELRVEGFIAALRMRGDDGPFHVVRHEYSIEGGISATTALLDDSPLTAIVAASDEIALGAVRAVRRRGLRVPEDISIVGYDDVYPLDYADPPLTSVRQPLERLAEAVVPVMTRLLKHRTVHRGELLFEPELIIRSSTSVPPTPSRRNDGHG